MSGLGLVPRGIPFPLAVTRTTKDHRFKKDRGTRTEVAPVHAIKHRGYGGVAYVVVRHACPTIAGTRVPIPGDGGLKAGGPFEQRGRRPWGPSVRA